VIKRSQTHYPDGKSRLIANLKQVQKNQILTAGAAPSVLTFARVCTADISLYRFRLHGNDIVKVNNSTFPHSQRILPNGVTGIDITPAGRLTIDKSC